MQMNRAKLFTGYTLAIAALFPPLLFALASNSYAESLQSIHAGVEPKNCTDSDCHAGIGSRQTLDPVIGDAHAEMLDETPGKDKWQCAWCHRAPNLAEDLKQAAGSPLDEKANLRQRVDVRLCVICHGFDPAPGMEPDEHKRFYQVNLEDLEPPPDGAELYDLACSGCHRPLEISKVSGESASKIQEAIDKDKGRMGPLDALGEVRIAAIAVALGGQADEGGGDGGEDHGSEDHDSEDDEDSEDD
jgi:hypothetical protein